MKFKKCFIIIFIIFSLSVISFNGVGAEVDAESDKVTTVILIRHAERDNFFMLTDQGREHARALVDAVGGMDISAILSPDLERNLDTVRPLANHLKIDISIIPRITPQTVDEIVGKILSRYRGKSVLVVGNGSGNLRALHQRLGGEGDGPYQYGDLFIYKIGNVRPVQVIKSRF
jgi:hypothetical protein